MVTAEAKRDDVDAILSEYNPDTKMAYVDRNGGKEEVVGHAEWLDIFAPHEYEDIIAYITELRNRTDVMQVSVIVTADFRVG